MGLSAAQDLFQINRGCVGRPALAGLNAQITIDPLVCPAGWTDGKMLARALCLAEQFTVLISMKKRKAAVVIALAAPRPYHAHIRAPHLDAQGPGRRKPVYTVFSFTQTWLIS
jgi:hypothetical protein